MEKERHSTHHRHGRRISRTAHLSLLVRHIMVGAALMLFVLYFAFGAAAPAGEMEFGSDAPPMTDTILFAVYATFAAAIALAIFTAIRGMVNRKTKRHRHADPCQLRTGVLQAGAGVLTTVCLLLTLAIGSSSPLAVGGGVYNDASWLRIADMMVSSLLVLIAVAIGVAVWATVRRGSRRN